MSKFRAALATACVLLLCLLFPATAATADQVGGVNFLVEPVPGSSVAPRGGYFDLAGSRGRALTQAIEVRNDSPDPLNLHLATVDAATAQLGGVAFTLDTQAPTQTGTWITLDQTALTLNAKASTTVGFRVTVPPAAASGVHLAGISVMAPTPGNAAGSVAADAAGASVSVQSRRVIAVQVNVPGPADPELVIHAVSPIARADGLHLQIAIENTGRGLTTAAGVITLPGDNYQRQFNIDTFVPATSIDYPITWTDNTEPGVHHAHVEIRYANRVAHWDGTFTVGQAVSNDQHNRQVPAPKATGNNHFPILPAAGGIVLAVVLLSAGITLGRRSTTAPPGPHPGRTGR